MDTADVFCSSLAVSVHIVDYHSRRRKMPMSSCRVAYAQVSFSFLKPEIQTGETARLQEQNTRYLQGLVFYLGIQKPNNIGFRAL